MMGTEFWVYDTVFLRLLLGTARNQLRMRHSMTDAAAHAVLCDNNDVLNDILKVIGGSSHVRGNHQKWM